LSRFIFSRTDYLIAASEHLALEVERQLGRPVPHRAIPMGMSQALFRPDGSSLRLRHADDERVVLFVGKLVPKKGLNVLLQAAAQLKARGRRIRVVVIGGGPLEESIRQSLLQFDLIDRVDLKGWVRNDQLPPYYRGADVVCVPSVRDQHGETEGTPVVLQEALGAGAIVVASHISGIPDVVRDGDNGWIVPPGDPKALARALTTALDMDNPSRQAMQQAARRTALGHSWERVAERYLEAFREAASLYYRNERR
jgi:glycosyltransferase involved in cell wall biosynthesis